MDPLTRLRVIEIVIAVPRRLERGIGNELRRCDSARHRTSRDDDAILGESESIDGVSHAQEQSTRRRREAATERQRLRFPLTTRKTPPPSSRRSCSIRRRTPDLELGVAVSPAVEDITYATMSSTFVHSRESL